MTLNLKIDVDDSAAAPDTPAAALDPAFTKFMQGFWDLANNDSETRQNGVFTIVSHLKEPEVVQKDVDYALKRLLRGVCSSRESARQGFAACVSELLFSLNEHQVSTVHVFEKLMEATRCRGNISKQEERDNYLGRIFGCAAIIQSGRLSKMTPDVLNVVTKMTQSVIEMYSKRSWIRQASMEIIISLFSIINPDQFATSIAPLVLPLLRIDQSATDEMTTKFGDMEIDNENSSFNSSFLSPEQLALLFALHQKQDFLHKIEDSVHSSILSNFPMLHEEHMLKPSPDMKFLGPLIQSSAAYPQLHSLWSHVLQDIGLSRPRPSNITDKSLNYLSNFWRYVVDEGLLDGSNSAKGTALLLFRHILYWIPESAVPIVVSPKILQTIKYCTGANNRHHSTLAREILQNLKETVKDNMEVQVTLALCLSQRGSLGFDSQTGTTVIADLLNEISPANIQNYTTFLQSLILRSKNDENANNADISDVNNLNFNENTKNALWAVTSLSKLIHNAKVIEILGPVQHSALTGQISVFFMKIGVFSQPDLDNQISEQVQEACEKQFFVLLSDLAVKPMLWKQTVDVKSTTGETLEVEHSGALELLYMLHASWTSFLKEGLSIINSESQNEDNKSSRKKMLKMLKQIRNSTDNSNDKISSTFAALLMQIGFLPLAEDIEADTGSFIDDLLEIYQRLVGKSDSVDEKEDDPLAVLADVLIAIFAVPGLHAVRGLRHVAKMAWRSVIATRPLTENALNCIISVVCSDESDPKNRDKDSEDENSEEISDNDSEDSENDSESLNVINENQRDAKHDEEEEQEEEIVLNGSELTNMLQGDSSDEEASGLLHHSGADQALIAMLNLKKGGQKARIAAARHDGLQLRLRVLDLLEVSCSRQFNSPLLATTMVSVYNAILTLSRFVGLNSGKEDKALYDRLSAFFKKSLCKVKAKIDDILEIMPSYSAEESFEYFIAQCKRCSKKDLAPLAHSGLWSTTKILQQINHDKAGKMFGDTLEMYLNKENGVRVGWKFFSDMITNFPNFHSFFVPVLLNGVKNAKSSYLKNSAAELLLVLIPKIRSLSDEKENEVKSEKIDILNTLTDVLVQSESEHEKIANSASANAKTLKPILDCCKLLLKGRNNDSIENEDWESTRFVQVIESIMENTQSSKLISVCRFLQSQCENQGTKENSLNFQKSAQSSTEKGKKKRTGNKEKRKTEDLNGNGNTKKNKNLQR